NKPDVAFLGEAPGATEDLQARPFIGPAGKMLDKMIAAMGYKREDVYLTNAVRCRPPENRTPEQSELDACGDYLLAEIRAVHPKTMILLGATAFKALVRGKKTLREVRGKWKEWQGIPVVATYHPSYLLRIQGSDEAKDIKKLAWGDLQLVLKQLERVKAAA